MKKLLCLMLILVILPFFSALKVYPTWQFAQRVPIGVPCTSLKNIEIQNTSTIPLEYVVSIRTATEIKMIPASERTPFLRYYTCDECEELFCSDERHTPTCPKCGSHEATSGERVYLFLEGREYLFEKIEEIPNTNWISVYPSTFWLEPNEEISVGITTNYPNDEKHFDKFYEFIVDIDPKIPEDKFTVKDVVITTEATTELQTQTFQFRIFERREDSNYIIVNDGVYPMITTSNDIADVLNVRIFIDEQWWEISPIYQLPYRLSANKYYTMIVNYKTTDINNLGSTVVTVKMKHRRLIPMVVTTASVRIWTYTTKDRKENNAVIKSGKVEFIDSPQTYSPTNTDLPVPSEKSYTTVIIGVIVVVSLLLILMIYRKKRKNI